MSVCVCVCIRWCAGNKQCGTESHSSTVYMAIVSMPLFPAQTSYSILRHSPLQVFIEQALVNMYTAKSIKEAIIHGQWII